jgi:serine/threonine-protein kinase HipA
MTETLDVHIGEAAIRVGTLRFEGRGREHSVFTYDDAWIQHPAGFPISPTMPFRQNTYFVTKGSDTHSSAFPGPISDTTPDAWGRAIVHRDEAPRDRPINDLDYLTAVDDASRLGALRFKGVGGDFLRPALPGQPRVPPVVEIEALMRASDAVEARTQTQKDILRLLGNGSSLGGARPKCTVIEPDGTLSIAKFTSKRDTLAVERAEVATLRLANKVGITAAEARVLDVAGRAVALIQRFDRKLGKRVPYVSAQTMLGRERADGGSYEAMAEVIRAHCAQPAVELRELFSRVAFTVLVGNTDDHLRNHGFLHAGRGQWELSPAFDVNPSPDRGRVLKTRISETSGEEASIDLLLKNANLFGLQGAEADQVVSAMSATVSASWRDLMKDAGMKPREIDAYEPAFTRPDAAQGKARAQTQVAVARHRGRRGGGAEMG